MDFKAFSVSYSGVSTTLQIYIYTNTLSTKKYVNMQKLNKCKVATTWKHPSAGGRHFKDNCNLQNMLYVCCRYQRKRKKNVRECDCERVFDFFA